MRLNIFESDVAAIRKVYTNDGQPIGYRVRQTVQTLTGIYGFFGSTRWLSNFHLAPVQFEGLLYPSTEHAYQAARYSQDMRKYCLGMTAINVMKWGRVKPRRSDHLDVMTEVIEQKFNEHPELKIKLHATGHQTIAEMNDWQDTYWGVCWHPEGYVYGENHLGEIIMRVRDRLR